MLLQLSYFFLPFIPLHPVRPPSSIPHLSLCLWVIYISSLDSPFPILSLTSPCLFCTYHLCFLFPVPFPPFSPAPSPLTTLHEISMSMILFLFWLFAYFRFVFVFADSVDNCEFVAFLMLIVLISFF